MYSSLHTFTWYKYLLWVFAMAWSLYTHSPSRTHSLSFVSGGNDGVVVVVGDDDVQAFSISYTRNEKQHRKKRQLTRKGERSVGRSLDCCGTTETHNVCMCMRVSETKKKKRMNERDLCVF